jgi:hypothetical protein
MNVSLLERPKHFLVLPRSHYSGATETSHLAHPTYAQQTLQDWTKPVGNDGHFTHEAEKIFRRSSPRIAVG